MVTSFFANDFGIMEYQQIKELFLYRKRDSNPHGRNAQGILSPSCLPFHHSGILYFYFTVQSYKLFFGMAKFFDNFFLLRFKIYFNIALFREKRFFLTFSFSTIVGFRLFLLAHPISFVEPSVPSMDMFFT